KENPLNSKLTEVIGTFLLFSVKYRMEGNKARTTSLYDGEAREIAHVKHVSELISKVLYRQKWDETKDKYLLPPDAPELVQAVKNAANYSKVSPSGMDVDELSVHYKKGHHERKAKYTSLPDPPEMELAKKVSQQRSRYTDGFFLYLSPQTFTESNVQCFQLIRVEEYYVRSCSYIFLSLFDFVLFLPFPFQKVYKASYEKSRGFSINYCDTPKFQMDSVLKQFSDMHYKDKYENEVKGHYIGSYEDLYMLHCQKVEEMKNEQLYKSDYEDIKTRCFFPQTITPEYEAAKKLHQCNDVIYRQHPGTVKFTQVVDSPVQVQAAINAKQLSDLNYKAEYEEIKMKNSLPPDYPFFIQSRVNAFNLSDNCYKYDWEKTKAKKFEIKGDTISILAARAHTNAVSDVKYKKEYEKNKGKMVGALSINDDPKMLHSVHVAKIQSDREYKKDYEKVKTKYHTPLDMLSVTLAKKSQAISSMAGYRSISTNYFLPPDSVLLDLAKKANIIQSDNEYKADYNSYTKGTPWVPYGSLEVEKAKKAAEILNEKKYRTHPDKIPFTSIDDHPIMMQAKVNQLQRSDVSQVSLFILEKEFLLHFSKIPFRNILVCSYFLLISALSHLFFYSCSTSETMIGYKKIPHSFILLPDNMHLQLCRNMMAIQSDNVYKSDYNSYSKGIGWVPIGSLDVEKAKTAKAALDERNYRQHPSNFKYTSKTDAMNMTLAMANSKQMDITTYKASGEKFMHTYHLPSDCPEFLQAKFNAQTISESHYRHKWVEDIAKGYDMKPDAIPILHAKHGRHIASNVQYKKDYEKARGHHVGFRSLQDDPLLVHYMEVTMIGYKKIPHSYFLLPDNMQLRLCRNMNLQSSDVSSIGWVPIGSLAVETAKVGGQIQSENKYRTHPSNFKFSKLMDSMDLALASANNQIMNKVQYFQMCCIGSQNRDSLVRDKNSGVVEMANKGYNLKADAIPILAYKYKLAYEKARGHHVGFRSLQDDPLLVHYMELAKMQSDKNYKKDYNKSKLKYHSPVDMVSVVHAKQASAAQTMAGYRQIQHTNALLPDAMNLELYKSEYEHYFKGIGWVPIGSLDVEKAKSAGKALNEKLYRQPPTNFKFTKDMHSMDLTLATTSIHIMPDAMDIVLARDNRKNYSEKLYKLDHELSKKKGHNLRNDAIAVQAAKASTTIASDYKYKTGYRKQVGHHIGARSIQDDPLLMLALNSAKIASDALYKKDFNKSKTKFHLPKCQIQVNDFNYRTHLHQWTCLPDSNDVVQARKAYDLQSDVSPFAVYKADLDEVVGVGWIPIGSLDVLKAKNAAKILSDRLYKQRPETLKYKTDMTSMPLVLAKTNADIMNKVTCNMFVIPLICLLLNPRLHFLFHSLFCVSHHRETTLLLGMLKRLRSICPLTSLSCCLPKLMLTTSARYFLSAEMMRTIKSK
uniref:SH3 domain-containing protein n=1 Tax=Neolamprologus brichardi TaxID=32507 RepID=A0A3Q4FYN3_NEOBR